MLKEKDESSRCENEKKINGWKKIEKKFRRKIEKKFRWNGFNYTGTGNKGGVHPLYWLYLTYNNT